MSLSVKDGATWKPPDQVLVKQAGAWVGADTVYVKSGGVWVPQWSSGPSLLPNPGLSQLTNSTATVIPFPAGIIAGDLLVLSQVSVAFGAGVFPTNGYGTGFTGIGTATATAGLVVPLNSRMSVSYKIAVGNESGTNLGGLIGGANERAVSLAAFRPSTPLTGAAFVAHDATIPFTSSPVGSLAIATNTKYASTPPAQPVWTGGSLDVNAWQYFVNGTNDKWLLSTYMSRDRSQNITIGAPTGSGASGLYGWLEIS